MESDLLVGFVFLFFFCSSSIHNATLFNLCNDLEFCTDILSAVLQTKVLNDSLEDAAAEQGCSTACTGQFALSSESLLISPFYTNGF